MSERHPSAAELYLVESMRFEDISQIRRIEKMSFPTPWPRHSYQREVLENDRARYLVVRRQSSIAQSPAAPRRRFPFSLLPFGPSNRADDLVAYGGLWLMIDEAHITTVAVHPNYRGRGIGELLLVEMAKLSLAAGAERMTLEVRVSNEIAQNLYRKYGFYENGLRPRYYSDDLEDALVMWSERIDAEPFQRRLERHEAILAKRLRWQSRW